MKAKILFLSFIVSFFFLYFLKDVTAIDISGCSDLDQAGKTYYLTADITGSSIPNCMDISANNIVLDCQGHTIDGNDVANYGIYVYRNSQQTTSVTIRNCILSDWNTANVYLYHADGNTLTNITSTSSPDYGFYLSYSDSNTITNSRVENNTNYGIFLYEAGQTGANKFYNNLFNNTDNFEFFGTIYANEWNTTKQTGNRIYSLGTEIGGNYWTNSTSNGYSDTCTDSDTDGFCDSSYTLETDNVDYLPLSDEFTSIPKYHDNSTNSTLAGAVVEHRLRWTDDIELDSYIFSFDNCTGSFSNITESKFLTGGTEDWSNVTHVINDTVGCTVRWKIYTNSTSDKWNASGIYSYITADEAPKYWDSSRSSSVNGSQVEFRLKWTDKIGLSGYVFYFGNGSYPPHWWNEGWNYRKSHTITGSSAGVQTNYQMNITVFYGTGTDNGKNVYVDNSRSDFGDIRFTWYNSASGQEQECDYWIETNYTGHNATFWIEIPQISTTSETIYIYYGKKDATTTNNGTNTFDFFDDFNSLDTNAWGEPLDDVYRGWDIENGNIVLYVGTRGKTTVWSAGEILETTSTYDLENKSFEIRTNMTMGGTLYSSTNFRTKRSGIGMRILTTGNAETRLYGRHEGVDHWLRYSLDTAETSQVAWSTASWNGSVTGYYILGLRRNGNEIKLYEDYNLETTYTDSLTIGNVILDIVTWPAYYNTYGWGEQTVDWARIRKLALPEPSHGTWGSEESYLTENAWTTFPSGGKQDWSNVTKGISSTVGATIRWRVSANDTNDYWNVSEVFSFTTAEAMITVNLTSYIVWWNDSVTVYGKSTGTTTVNITVSNINCVNISDSNGDWTCTFNAPLELGTYTINAKLGVYFLNTTTLTVRPKYGKEPIGKTDRVVYEQPMLIQEPSGRIRIVWARIKVWRG